MPPKRAGVPTTPSSSSLGGLPHNPTTTTTSIPTTTASGRMGNKKGGKSSSSPGLLHTLGMRLSGSNLVLVLLVIFLLYAYWDSHQLYHLIEGQVEFNVVVNRVIDGDTFVGTIQDTYGDDEVPIGSMDAGEVCVPVPCSGSGGGGGEMGVVDGGSAQQCCRRTRLVVKGGLMAWFRLRRIDAPELPSPTRHDTQPYALEAKSALEGLLLRGEPLLPVGHSANEMMLQAAYMLDHPVLPSSSSTPDSPDQQQHTLKKMSRSDLARSQVITLPHWGDDADDATNGDDGNHKNTHTGSHSDGHPQNPMINNNNRGITVSLRIVEQDKSGRYVVDAFVHTSPLSNVATGRLWVSHEMVRAGLAWGYAASVSPSSSSVGDDSSSSSSSSPSPSPLQVSVAEVFMEPLVVAMSAARREGRGLWSSAAAAVEPWRWRIESAATAEARDHHSNQRGRRSVGEGGGRHRGATTHRYEERSSSSAKDQRNVRHQQHDSASTNERPQQRVNGGKSKRGGRWDRRPTY